MGLDGSVNMLSFEQQDEYTCATDIKSTFQYDDTIFAIFKPR